MTELATTCLQGILGTLLLLVGASVFFTALSTPSPEACDPGDKYIAWIGIEMIFCGAWLLAAAVF